MLGKGIIILIMLFIFVGCYPARYDGPYKGRIVDAVTGKPIEGVVVLGVWYRVAPSPGGGVSSYYDARETVTDKNGDFEMKGLGLKILSNIGPMDVLIFKAGYEYIAYPWETLMAEADARKVAWEKKVRWEGGKAIISLRKLTMEERKDSATYPPGPDAPDEKARMMIDEIRKERKERGLD